MKIFYQYQKWKFGIIASFTSGVEQGQGKICKHFDTMPPEICRVKCACDTMNEFIPWNLSFHYIDCTGQFTPKMKANAEPHLLSSLVWIDSGVVVSQHRLESLFSNGMTSFMEFMSGAETALKQLKIDSCTHPPNFPPEIRSGVLEKGVKWETGKAMEWKGFLGYPF